jgi:hypothetical protein
VKTLKCSAALDSIECNELTAEHAPAQTVKSPKPPEPCDREICAPEIIEAQKLNVQNLENS